MATRREVMASTLCDQSGNEMEPAKAAAGMAYTCAIGAAGSSSKTRWKHRPGRNIAARVFSFEIIKFEGLEIAAQEYAAAVLIP